MALRARSIIELLINAKDQASAQLNKIGAGLSSIASKAKLAGVALIAAFSASLFGGGIKSAAKFEESLDRIQSVTRATAEEMRQLEEAANKAGTETKFTADEAAGALENLVRSGKSASEAVALLPQVLSLATAETLDLAEASGFVTKTLAQFNFGIEQTQRVVDVLVATSQSATTNVAGVGAALRDAGIVAAQSGLSLEETTAAIGVLADASIDGERAGVALRNIILALQDPASTTRQSLKELGIESSDLIEVIDGLSKSTGDVDKAFLGFDTRAVPAIRALVQNNEKVKQLADNFKDVEGRAKEAADVMSDNLQGATTRLSSAWDSLSRAVAKPFIGPITAAIDGIATFTQKASGFITQLIADIKVLRGEATEAKTDIENIGKEFDANQLKKALVDLDAQFIKNRSSFQDARLAMQALRLSGDETSITYKHFANRAAQLDVEFQQLLATQRGLAFSVQSQLLPGIKETGTVAEEASKGAKKLTKSLKDLLDTGQITKEVYDKQIAAIQNAEAANKKYGATLKNVTADEKLLAKETVALIESYKLLGVETEGIEQNLKFDGSIESAKAYFDLMEAVRKKRLELRDASLTAAEEERKAEEKKKAAQEETEDRITKITHSVQSQVPFWGILSDAGQAALREIITGAEQAEGSTSSLADKVQNVADRYAELATFVQKLSSERILTPAFAAQIQLYSDLADQIRRAESIQDALNDAYRTGTITLSELNRLEREANRGLSLLNEQSLDQLRGQIARLRDEMDSFTESTKDATDALNEQLLRLKGDESALQALKIARERQRIEEQLADARAKGNAKAVAELKKQLDLLKEIDKLEKNKLTTRTRPAPNTPAPTNGTPRPTGGGLTGGFAGGLNPNFYIVAFDERQKDALARDIRNRLRNLNRLNS